MRTFYRRSAHFISGFFIKALLITSVAAFPDYAQEEHPSFHEYYLDGTVAISGNGTINSPWKTFADIRLDTMTLDWVKINVRPTTYTKSGTTSFLTIRNRNGTCIAKDSRYSGDVILNAIGNDTVDIGIYCFEDEDEPTSNIIIDGINFINFHQHAVYVSGDSIYNIYNFKLVNCNIQAIGFDDTTRTKSYAGIRIRHTDNIYIENNYLKMIREVEGQTDGIQINDTCSNIRIQGNYLEVTNSTSESHLDVVQLAALCTNVNINSNYLVYESNTDNISGILIDGTDGEIIIYNNIVYSKYEKNLVDVHLEAETDAAWIYNNTLYCDGNPANIINITNDGSISPQNVFRIKNNVIYKEGASVNNNSVSIYFINVNPANVNSTQLNYNAHYNANSPDSIHFDQIGRYPISAFETDFVTADPLLDVNNNYKLLFNSPCKNKGISLYNAGVNYIKTDYSGKKRPYWTENSFDIGAFELPDAHIKIGRPTATDYRTNIEAIGPVFVRNGISWEVTSSSNLQNLSFTTNNHCADDSLYAWDGVNFSWLHQGAPGDTNSPAGIGLYRYTYYNDQTKYFYLDTRDANYSVTYNPNIYIQYNSNRWEYFNGTNFSNIDDGSVIRAWEILNQTPEYNSIWSDILAVFGKVNPNTQVLEPYLDWRPYSGFEPVRYRIYFAMDAGGFNKIDSVSANVYSYQHNGMSLGTNEGAYYVEAVGLGGTAVQTNTVYIGVGGKYKQSAAGLAWIENDLLQNYPNPFNPLTRIQYTVSNPGLVSLKVFDILGREVKTLVNEIKATGSYEAMFNPTDLASGIYIYQLRVNKYTSVKKMQYIK